MPRIAVISDIHSNIYALEVILQDIQKRRNIDEIICLGDIVGYYPFPNECIELIREECSISMLGNHDAGVIGDEPSFYFNPTAYTMIQWTQDNIHAENKKWLTTLPRRKTIERDDCSIYLVHGSPFKTFDYMDTYSDKKWKTMLEEAFEITKTNVLMVGHTHVPFKAKIKKHNFLNPGSVGQPRNGKPGAYYSIVNTNPYSAAMIHLKYDYKPVQEKMNDLDLPKSLSDRLNHGR